MRQDSMTLRPDSGHMGQVARHRARLLHAVTRWALGALATLTAVMALGADPASGPIRSGTVAINGVDYYYELRGKGEPLLLLHGGLGSIEMFGPLLGRLSQQRRVIAVDLQGHGRTVLGERPFSLVTMGDDMASLVEGLGFREVDVLGYSMGGGVAFQMAAQHPERVRRLAMVSTPYSDDGYYPDIRQQQNGVSAQAAPMMKDTPMYRGYAAVAPRVDDFPLLLDAVGGFMREHYDWSASIARLTMPVMLVYGDADMIRPEHIVRFYQALGGGLRDAGWQRETMASNRLAILPGRTHYDIFLAPALLPTVLPFLDGRSDSESWAGSQKGPKGSTDLKRR